MKTQKLFKVMSVMGVLFCLFIIISYFQMTQNRGDIMEGQIEVPRAFANDFSNIIVRKRAAEMPLATFLSPEGRRVNWETFDGNYLLVNFWATWCPPCVVELPSLNKLQLRYEDKGLNVIAVSLDTMRDQKFLKGFLINRGIGEFAAYHDDVEEVQKAIYMRGIPTSYLLSPKGEILYIFEGDADWSSTAAYQFFDDVIASNLGRSPSEMY